jgi:hypothetical protein
MLAICIEQFTENIFSRAYMQLGCMGEYGMQPSFTVQLIVLNFS